MPDHRVTKRPGQGLPCTVGLAQIVLSPFLNGLHGCDIFVIAGQNDDRNIFRLTLDGVKRRHAL